MARDELQAVLDFILNRAEDAELEVLIKAIERRRRDQGKYAGLGGMNPGALADKMAKSVNQGVAGSMDSIRSTVRTYVEGIIRQNAPEATEEEVAALLKHFVGRVPGEKTASSLRSETTGGQHRKASREPRGLVDMDDSDEAGAIFGDDGNDEGEGGRANLPADAIAMMLRDFTEYSLGLMPPSKQKELWDWMPRWQDMYWQSFSPELKSLVKARLEGKLDENDFWKAALSILGL